MFRYHQTAYSCSRFPAKKSSTRRMTYRYAGIRNRSANSHASGFATHAPRNPNIGTSTKPAIPRAIISLTPEKIASVLKPIP